MDRIRKSRPRDQLAAEMKLMWNSIQHKLSAIRTPEFVMSGSGSHYKMVIFYVRIKECMLKYVKPLILHELEMRAIPQCDVRVTPMRIVDVGKSFILIDVCITQEFTTN